MKLDEPAATYLPELSTLQVLEGGTLRAPRASITVRQLLLMEDFDRAVYAWLAP